MQLNRKHFMSCVKYKRKSRESDCKRREKKWQRKSKETIRAGAEAERNIKNATEAFDEKMELMKKKGYAVLDHDLIKTPAQIEKIKESCKINIAVLDYVAEHIGPGVTTQQIDDWVHEETVRHWWNSGTT